MHTQLLIIGAGPGGYETALLAARRGLDVTIVEKGAVGGTCLNEGCIPTKALCRTAEILSTLSDAETFGVKNVSYAFDFPAAMARKDAVVEQLRGGVESLLANSKIRLVRGEARFVEARTVEVNGERYEADDVIIAVGSVPAMLPIEGCDLPEVLTSREILSLDVLPKRLCIVGGGVIGLEFASVFDAFGCEVTVLEYAKEVLPHFDTELAKRLRQLLGRRGIAIETQAEVTGIAKDGDGVHVAYRRKGKECVAGTDMVLMAVGRKANVSALNLADAGIEFTPKGIKVDEMMQTNVPHVYAVGDVNGQLMLAHAAIFQGMRALNHIMGRAEGDGLRLDIVPAAVFTMPETASVGMTEDECRERGIAHECKKAFFRANGKAVALGETDGFCKLITSGNTLLGCHVCGPHAADVVQEACALIASGATLDDLKHVVHAHPTVGEILQSVAHS